VCVDVGGVVLCRCVCVCDLWIFLQVEKVVGEAKLLTAARVNPSFFAFTRGPPSRGVKCLWEVFVWGFGVLFLSGVCVCMSLCRCVCMCVCVTC